jgi:hypothetical protein
MGFLDWLSDLRRQRVVSNIGRWGPALHTSTLRLATDEDRKYARALLNEVWGASGSPEAKDPAALQACLQRLSEGDLMRLYPYQQGEFTPKSGSDTSDMLLAQAIILERVRRAASAPALKKRAEEACKDFCDTLVQLASHGLLVDTAVADQSALAAMPVAKGASRVTPLDVTLVHGTWAARRRKWFAWKNAPQWYDGGSIFRSVLQFDLEDCGFDPTIVAFKWSGQNSIFARDRAAERLATYLRSRLSAGGDRHLLIAHSHGGNIALLAVDKLTRARGLAKESVDLSRLHIATLATPFLQVVDNPSRHYFMALLIMYLSLPLLFVTILGSHGTDILEFIRHNTAQLQQGVFEPRSLLGLSTLLFMTFLAAYSGFKLGQCTWYSIVDPSRVGDGRGVTRWLSMASNYQVGSQSALLVVRSVSDEASIALALGSLASRLSHYFDSALGSRLIPFLFGALIGTALAIVASRIWPSAFAEREFWSDFLYLALLVFLSCAAVLIGLRFLMMCLRLVFGRELFLAPHRCEIDTASAPDASQNLTIVTLPPHHDREVELHHSIYEHPMCADLIARWLKLGSRGESAASRSQFSSSIIS